MTNVWGRRGISTLLLMQYLLIVVGHGAEGHSLGFSFKTPQVFSLSVSHSAHAKSARRILFRIFITPPGFSARPQGSREVKIKPYILHPLCKRRFAGTIFDPFLWWSFPLGWDDNWDGCSIGRVHSLNEIITSPENGITLKQKHL